MSQCGHLEEVRDYVFDELPAPARRQVEEHLAGCAECAAELDGMQLTTAALRILPDQEIPRRIAFVSDKVFEPAGVKRWFQSGWLGFASACVLAAGMVVSAFVYRPITVAAPVVASQVDISAQVNEAVNLAVSRVRAEDAQAVQTALAAAEQKHQQEHNALLAAMNENLNYLTKRYSSLTTLASRDAVRFGAAQ